MRRNAGGRPDERSDFQRAILSRRHRSDSSNADFLARHLLASQCHHTESPSQSTSKPIVRPRHECDDGSMLWQGELLHIHVASKAAAPMEELQHARLVAGIGIEGDRYAAGLGTYSKRPHLDRQVTLIEIEVLEAIARDRQIELAVSEHRRNLTTRGVPLGHLVGQYFRVGDCVLYGGRMNVPCLYLETLLGKKVFKPLLNRSGLNCRIVMGGIIRNLERIEWCDPASHDISVRLANEASPLEPPPET